MTRFPYYHPKSWIVYHVHYLMSNAIYTYKRNKPEGHGKNLSFSTFALPNSHLRNFPLKVRKKRRNPRTLLLHLLQGLRVYQARKEQAGRLSLATLIPPARAKAAPNTAVRAGNRSRKLTASNS